MNHDEYVNHLARAYQHARQMVRELREAGQLTMASNWECDLRALEGCLEAADENAPASHLKPASASHGMKPTPGMRAAAFGLQTKPDGSMTFKLR